MYPTFLKRATGNSEQLKEKRKHIDCSSKVKMYSLLGLDTKIEVKLIGGKTIVLILPVSTV